MSIPAHPHSPLLTVAVMLFNEADNLEHSIQDILAVSLPVGWHLEILIIDDGSTDGSDAIAERLAAVHPNIRIVRHSLNQGLGQVYRTGFESARGDWLTFLPADGQIPMSEVLLLLQARESHQVDLVLGTLPGGRESFTGHLLSTIERMMFRTLFGRTPPFQGIFLIRTEILRHLPLHSQGRGWAIVLEMIIRADRTGCRWCNQPTTLLPRRSGRSKVNNLRTVMLSFVQLLRLRWLLWVHPS